MNREKLQILKSNELIETCLETRVVHHGRFLTIRDDLVELPGGYHAKREFVQHRGSAMVVPVCDDGNVVVENIFRYPIGQVCLEFPAGMVDQGEDSFTCARRELLEETGFIAGEWAFLGRFYNAAPYSSECIDLWLARKLIYEQPTNDVFEPLQVLKYNFQQLLSDASKGLVSDMRTAMATMLAANALDGSRQIDWINTR